MIFLENQREVRSVLTRNQSGAINNARDIQQKFTDVFETEIAPIVAALTNENASHPELEVTLQNAIARDGGQLLADAKAYEMALNDLERGYAGVANEEYPFREKLRDLTQRNRSVANGEKQLVEEKFEKMCANAKGEDNGEGFVITDDFGNGGGGLHGGQIMNTKCPLSGLPLKDLKEPVEDAVGIVYEKEAVLVFLGRAGKKKCPEAMRNHIVTKAELKVSEKVMRMKRMGERTREANVDEIISP
jgi:hypothetical protein